MRIGFFPFLYVEENINADSLRGTTTPSNPERGLGLFRYVFGRMTLTPN